MHERYSANTESPNEDEKSSKRLLRRLRILLIIWILSLFAVIIWFSLGLHK